MPDVPPPPKKLSPHHPRSVHNAYESYDKLAAEFPYLLPALVSSNRINYSDATSQILLTKALLEKHYGVSGWDIPRGVLCPPVPRSANYIHSVADLFPEKYRIDLKGFDIGVGYSCIFPLLGRACYGWAVNGCDVDEGAVAAAAEKIGTAAKEKDGSEDRLSQAARSLKMLVQSDVGRVFQGVVGETDRYAFCVCNPPFHESAQYARISSANKWGGSSNVLHTDSTVGGPRDRTDHGTHSPVGGARERSPKRQLKCQYGGRENELTCEGGELGFAERMLRESLEVGTGQSAPSSEKGERSQKNQPQTSRTPKILWFTILLSRYSSVQKFRLQLEVKRGEVKEFHILELKQGKQTMWVACWSLLSAEEREAALATGEYRTALATGEAALATGEAALVTGGAALATGEAALATGENCSIKKEPSI